MTTVLTKDDWLDNFYDLYIYVKDPEGSSEFYLDKEQLQNIIPELISNDKIQYHKISLIHLLKIYYINQDLKDIKKYKKTYLLHIYSLWFILAILIVCHICQYLSPTPPFFIIN